MAISFSEKKLLQGKYLKLVGGYKIPLATINNKNTRWGGGSVDLLPGTNQWLLGHSHANHVIELIEPENLGTGEMTSWPEMTLSRTCEGFESVEKISPTGVFWLNSTFILTSGRKSYRSGFESKWMQMINLDTKENITYSIFAKSEEYSDFHLLQSLGSGFMRITDQDWANNYANGNNFLLGRGGYDVLGSPLGPALGVWNIGEDTAKFVLDFPMGNEQKRDIYYLYPETAHRLPMWKSANGTFGYWQAGDVGGFAHINHPEIKGIIATHNHGRGIFDYDAQGDPGSGSYFLVEDPSLFYSDYESSENRGNHKEKTENAIYPKGVYARVGIVYDPDDIAKVAKDEVERWEVPSVLFEWPREGIEWTEFGNPTKMGGLVWDNDRQYLWAVIIKSDDRKYLAAYEIVVDDSRTEEPIRLPENFLQYLGLEPDSSNTLEFSFIHYFLIVLLSAITIFVLFFIVGVILLFGLIKKNLKNHTP